MSNDRFIGLTSYWTECRKDDNCVFITNLQYDFILLSQTIVVPKVTLQKSLDEVISMEATVTCQHPLPNLYEFLGNIEAKFSDDEFTTGSLTIENVLLRGSRLKDTEFVIGTAVYTGRDTKLSLNSKNNPNKFSTVEK